MNITEALPIALEFLGDALPVALRWRPGIKCVQNSDVPIGYPCERNAPSRSPHWGRNKGDHDIPCPPLTDALAMAMLRATGVPIQPYDSDAVTGKPVTWMSWVGDTFFYTDDPAEAIVLAVAALAEKVAP